MVVDSPAGGMEDAGVFYGRNVMRNCQPALTSQAVIFRMRLSSREW
jgi:hypothetical protein